MVDAHRRHHRAAAIAGAHDRAAHRVPHVHEAQRARGVGADAPHIGAARPQRREIVADPAALLHRQRRLAQMREDAAHVIRDRSHDEAVEQRYLPLGPGPGDDPPRRQKTEIVHRGVEPLGPTSRVLLGGGEGARDAAPGVLDRPVDRLAVRTPEPIFHIPDLLRDRRNRDHPPCPFTEPV